MAISRRVFMFISFVMPVPLAAPVAAVEISDFIVNRHDACKGSVCSRRENCKGSVKNGVFLGKRGILAIPRDQEGPRCIER